MKRFREILAGAVVALAFAGGSDALAQQFSGCGTLVQSVECVMFQADAGGLYSLDVRGTFVVGDRVFVTGTVDPGCFTICQQGNGCIRQNTIARCDCATGNVNAGVGAATDVLTMNGATRSVHAAIGEPVRLVVVAPPAGPASQRYVLYAWTDAGTSPTEARAQGQRLGCTVDPTPLAGSIAPQPFRCARGGVPAAACGGVAELRGAPARAPFSLLLNGGFRAPIVVTVQLIVEDAGSANSTGFSVSNAVTLQVP
jgi:hypothetical protein